MKKDELIKKIQKIDPEIEGLEKMTSSNLKALYKSLAVSDDDDNDDNDDNKDNKSSGVEVLYKNNKLLLVVDDNSFELPFRSNAEKYARDVIRQFYNQKIMARGSANEDKMLTNIDRSFYCSFAKTVLDDSKIKNEGFLLALSKSSTRDSLLEFGIENLEMIYKAYISAYNIKERY